MQVAAILLGGGLIAFIVVIGLHDALRAVPRYIGLDGTPTRGHKSGQAAFRYRVDLAEFRETDLVSSLGYYNSSPTQFLKRCLDIAAALTLLIFLAPLLVLTALLVIVDSSGPVFYRQTRVGLGGREFRIWKFRSMRTDAEQGGAQWAKKNDDRVTRVGRIIRKTRIDEIPQAINVLKGDMSFVGPRPERPEFVDILRQEIPGYDVRHAVKPGITGWAQVLHEYGASVEDARAKLTYDLFYIKNYSLLMDLGIILKTVRVALFGIGSR
ncbi:MAG: exopolysaccharide biosynthesis polyprenyl glycosylphosphotransferase [Pseudomonadota bacterium]